MGDFRRAKSLFSNAITSFADLRLIEGGIDFLTLETPIGIKCGVACVA